MKRTCNAHSLIVESFQSIQANAIDLASSIPEENLLGNAKDDNDL